MSWIDLQPIFNGWAESALDVLATYILPLTGTTLSPASGTWVVPSGVRIIRVEAIGMGGMGTLLNYGGGGGAYSRTNRLFVNEGQTIFYRALSGSNVLTQSSDSWLNISENQPPTSKSHGVLAKRGEFGNSTLMGLGGRADQCIGDVAFSGGNAGASSSLPLNNFGGGGGGGGSAGPNGNGGNGGSGFNDNPDGSGGGGGANGGSNGENASLANNAAGKGGNNRFDSGGGNAGTLSILSGVGVNGGGGGGAYAISTSGDFRRGASGGMEVIWTDSMTGLTAGPGGGGGGSRGSQLGGKGGGYGGGSGANSSTPGPGLIVVIALRYFWFDSPKQSQVWT